jgi:hypothetical protein
MAFRHNDLRAPFLENEGEEENKRIFFEGELGFEWRRRNLPEIIRKKRNIAIILQIFQLGSALTGYAMYFSRKVQFFLFLLSYSMLNLFFYSFTSFC